MSGLASFLLIPADGTELSCHGKIVLVVKSRLTGRSVLFKVNLVSGRAKNADSCALASSPIESVSVAGFVRVEKV